MGLTSTRMCRVVSGFLLQQTHASSCCEYLLRYVFIQSLYSKLILLCASLALKEVQTMVLLCADNANQTTDLYLTSKATKMSDLKRRIAFAPLCHLVLNGRVSR